MVWYQLSTSCSLISISVLPKATHFTLLKKNNNKKRVLKETKQPHAPWPTATSKPAICCNYMLKVRLQHF